MSLSELGRKILRSGGNMTLVASNLEKRGLVRRDRSADDRRVMHMMLTAKGQRLIEAVWPKHVELLVQSMSVLGAAEQEELARLCKKLGLGQKGV
jgi:MarR family 2-MHQ and catechol resistance regulon transcriptional repressor